MKLFKILAAVLFLPFVGYSQQAITFQINSAGETLSGAGIRIQQGNAIVQGITDQNGTYQYASRQGQNMQIEVTYTGMRSIDTVLNAESGSAVVLEMHPLPELLQPVEVRSTRASTNSPFTKTDLNKAFIEKYNTGQDLPFVLNQTPNVVANSDAGNGIGYTGIRIRGSDASRINMTINGIPYNDPESQGTFFVNLPDFVSSVSSIQVQRGVGTSSNGAGAFGATMNFNTLQYNEDPYLELNNSFGSFNTLKNTLRVGTGIFGNYFTFDGRISRISSDGYIDRAFTNLLGGQGTLGFYKGNTSIRLNVLAGREKTYQAWNGVSEEDLKNNRTINYAGMEKPGEPYDDETDNYWQNHYQLFFNHTFNNRWVLSAATYAVTGKGYYKQYKAGEDLADYLLSPVDGQTESDLIRRLWLRNKMFGQNISLFKKNEWNEWTLGGGWNHYPARHVGDVIWSAVQPEINHVWYDNDAEKNDFNAFVKWQRSLNENLNLFTDLQYRHIRYEIEGFRDNPDIRTNQTWNFINPKIGVSYKQNNLFTSLSYALGNKEPNRDDFEAGLTQIPKREQLHDFEFNLNHRNLPGGIQGQFTLYYMHYIDQLVLTGKINDVGAYTRINMPVSYRTGAEWDFNWNNALWAIRYNGAVSANKIKDFTEYIDDYENGGQYQIHHGTTDISFSPSSVQFGAIAFKPFKGLEAEWSTKYVSRQFLDNTSNRDRSLDAYWVSNLRFGYQFTIPKMVEMVNVAFQINNILNELYAANGYTYGANPAYNYYFPMATRNWMVTLNLKF